MMKNGYVRYQPVEYWLNNIGFIFNQIADPIYSLNKKGFHFHTTNKYIEVACWDAETKKSIEIPRLVINDFTVCNTTDIYIFFGCFPYFGQTVYTFSGSNPNTYIYLSLYIIYVCMYFYSASSVSNSDQLCDILVCSSVIALCITCYIITLWCNRQQAVVKCWTNVIPENSIWSYQRWNSAFFHILS